MVNFFENQDNAIGSFARLYKQFEALNNQGIEQVDDEELKLLLWDNNEFETVQDSISADDDPIVRPDSDLD